MGMIRAKIMEQVNLGDIRSKIMESSRIIRILKIIVILLVADIITNLRKKNSDKPLIRPQNHE